MPLPIPDASAKMDGNKIILTIHKDAWFFEGQTMFRILNHKINLISAKLINNRVAELEFDEESLIGEYVEFESKNIFYWHLGRAKIE